MTYTIPIHGLIGLQEDGQKSFMVSDLLLHLANSKDYNHLHLDIASDGGYCDESRVMVDLIKNTNKLITSSNSGNVASAATPIFLIPLSQSLRTFNPTKGQFLIHNPWTETQGDAQYLAEVSKSLLKTENEYAKIYAEKTNTDIDILKAFMKENVPLTTEQIESLGFATIVQNEFKAVAKLNLKTDTMTEELKTEFTKLETLINGVKALFKPKALMIADVNGNEITFPEINDIAELKVGVTTTAPKGEYLQANGETIVIAGGVVTEIKVADNSEDVEALKAEIEALKQANIEALATAENLKTENTKALAELESFKATAIEAVEEFKNFKAKMSNYTPTKSETETTGKTKSNFNFKRK